MGIPTAVVVAQAISPMQAPIPPPEKTFQFLTLPPSLSYSSFNFATSNSAVLCAAMLMTLTCISFGLFSLFIFTLLILYFPYACLSTAFIINFTLMKTFSAKKTVLSDSCSYVEPANKFAVPCSYCCRINSTAILLPEPRLQSQVPQTTRRSSLNCFYSELVL